MAKLLQAAPLMVVFTRIITVSASQAWAQTAERFELGGEFNFMDTS